MRETGRYIVTDSSGETVSFCSPSFILKRYIRFYMVTVELVVS